KNHLKIKFMNYRTLKSTLTATMAFVILSSSVTFARLDDRTTYKTRDAVENASPDDWYTLAISAEKCFKKKVNLKEASEWLDQSLEIAETPFNLELKGDYYNNNRLPDKALEYYVRTMNKIKENDGDADVTHIQKKIAKITNIGG
ncbi:MAG: hypothetical protein KAQ79_22595, partial [Cyclobacteriaceae bacterium]|nr:hypothetical protein [Cyclobacteriaceae bacterium]